MAFTTLLCLLFPARALSDDWMAHRCEVSRNRLEIEWRVSGDRSIVSVAYLVLTWSVPESVLGPYPSPYLVCTWSVPGSYLGPLIAFAQAVILVQARLTSQPLAFAQCKRLTVAFIASSYC